MKKILPSTKKGDMLIALMVVVFLFVLIMTPVTGYVATEIKVARSTVNMEQALQIAEAGVNYYQWHLAHFPTDYQDGTGTAGPYVHSYKDLDTEQVIGQYSLVITPPVASSTIVTIQSTGSTSANPNITRTITARYGVPSLAKYSFLSNDVIWIGPNETVGGQMQSNNGVRFDGVTNAPVQSAKTTYTCPSGQGSPCPATENGVWGSAAQSSQNFWQFPVPSVDFSSLTSNLATLKSSAMSGGIYLAPSNTQGYSLVFNSAGTVSVYKITSLTPTPTAYDISGATHNEDIDYNARTLQYTKSIPANGIIYVEDKVWVEGVVKGRVMVVAAQLPYNSSTAPDIYIPNNITYAAKDGTNTLGLLSQSDIIVTYGAPNNLEIDAAMIAQNGSAQFYYYGGDAGSIKNAITVFGSIMTYGQWTWTWVNGSGGDVGGYATTNDIYDSNLLYYPPPGFPLSSAGYQQVSWTSN